MKTASAKRPRPLRGPLPHPRKNQAKLLFVRLDKYPEIRTHRMPLVLHTNTPVLSSQDFGEKELSGCSSRPPLLETLAAEDRPALSRPEGNGGFLTASRARGFGFYLLIPACMLI